MNSVDEKWMRRCIVLARFGFGKTAPNPMVGAVLVDADGQFMAEGFHRGPGQPHAEIEALAHLGGRAPGATLYVNLEPCNHFGRTPPCAAAVVASGVSRVVFGMNDPIPGHAGGGDYIARHGIVVESGVLALLCEELNLSFARWARRQPRKSATTTPQLGV